MEIEEISNKVNSMALDSDAFE